MLFPTSLASALRCAFLSLALFLTTGCQSKKNTQAIIHTSMGDIRVRLYDDTPRHRDFFLRLIRLGAYDSLRVRRIERDFVVQSGYAREVPQLTTTPPAQTQRPLLRGALAANGSLFFIVQGRPQTDATLDKWEQQLGKKFSPELRALYKQKGGAPQLDGQYTVFGEVAAGIDVVDKIAALPRNSDDEPLETVTMRVKTLERQ